VCKFLRGDFSKLSNRTHTKSSLPGFKFIYKILYSRPFPSDLKTDQVALKTGKQLKVIFEILKIPTILHLLLLVSRV